MSKNKTLTIIDQHDVDLFSKHVDSIVKESQKMKLSLVEPYEEEIRQINDIVLSFVKEKKRKIYGGYALNLLLTSIDKALSIYNTSNDIPDIDFYSPDPLKDLITLCNILHQKGYKNVQGREAIHKETYSLKVQGQLYCDITYVPKNIYNKMPFKEINNMYVIGSEFMLIDYFRMMTDIILTNWRIEKTFVRMFLLQKYFPLPYINNSITVPPPGNPVAVNKLMSIIHKFLENNDRAVTVGFYAYDHFVLESGISQNSKYKLVEVPYYEIILTEYRADARTLIKQLKDTYSEYTTDVTTVENYPFFQFFGHSVNIYYKNTMLAKLFNNNKKCIPYTSVKSHVFDNNKYTKGNSEMINIGSFNMTLLYALITVMKARVDDDRNTKHIYYTLISNIVESRNYYMAKNKKTIFDDTIFKEFVIPCIGVPITPENERKLIIESRKKLNKKYMFLYDPAENIKEAVNYVFANSSGNPINNAKNLKLTDETLLDVSDISSISNSEILENNDISFEDENVIVQ